MKFTPVFFDRNQVSIREDNFKKLCAGHRASEADSTHISEK